MSSIGGALLQCGVIRRSWIGMALLAMACSGSSAYGAGNLDVTYGGSGLLRAPNDQPEAGLSGAFRRVLPAPGDHLYLISHAPGDNCCYQPVITVNLVDRAGLATWDQPVSFEPALPLFDAVVRPGGGLLIGGGNDAGGFVAALDADGRPDPVLGSASQRGFDSTVTALALQADGRLLVATQGKIGSDSDGYELCLDDGWTVQRLQPDGSLDPTFGSDGRLRSAQVDMSDGARSCTVSRLYVESDGRIVLDSRRTYRLSPSGALDGTFHNGDQLWLANTPFMRLVDGGWLTVESIQRGSFLDSDTRLVRYDGNGAVDRSFGPEGDGTVTFDFGEINTGDAATSELAPASFEIPDDGMHYFTTAWTYRQPTGAYPIPTGQIVARLLRDGRLDPSFGRDGIVRLTTGTQPVMVGMVPQSDGGLVLATQSGILRLSGGNEPSSGAIDARLEQVDLREDAGPARVVVSRNAGSDTPISVSYRTVQDSAIAGVDFQAASGRLDWAAGDASDRIVEVPVIDDMEYEPYNEMLKLELIVESGGAVNFAPTTLIYIRDDDTVTPPPPPPPSGGSGGGGSGGLALLMLLAPLVYMRAATTSRR